MLGPHDELPPPVKIRPERPSLIPFAVLALIAFLGWLAFDRMTVTTPIAVSGTSASTAVVSPPAVASPIAIALSLTVVVVTETPIPDTPTPIPRYTPLASPPPIDICITSTPKGTVCSQPQPPLPTNTPLADCPVSPGEPCVWNGGPVRWPATPTPESSTNSNQ
jgi:hypothetical protein